MQAHQSKSQSQSQSPSKKSALESIKDNGKVYASKLAAEGAEIIKKGIDEGAKLVCGGTGLPEGVDAGHYVKPTVFSEANNDMTISREEIFGPVLTMIPYDSEEEAIRIANDTPYGLAGYVQSGDMDHARAVAARIRAGNIHINGASGGPDIPFGGFKQSGIGRELGEYGLEQYSEVKTVTIKISSKNS